MTTMGTLFIGFTVLFLLGAIAGWASYIHFRNQHPAIRSYSPAGGTQKSDKLLWTSRGGIRLPLDMGGLHATWPLASFSATTEGIHVGGLPIIPRLDIQWERVRRIEAVRGGAVRVFAAGPKLAFLALALKDRDNLLSIAEARGVDVERTPQPAHWWTGGGL